MNAQAFLSMLSLRMRYVMSASSDTALIDRIKFLQERVAAQKDALTKVSDQRKMLSLEASRLRKELQSYKKRDYGQDIDAVRHNTKESMDAFFSEIDDLAPYLKFASALKATLEQYGIEWAGKSILDWGTGPGVVLHDLVKDCSPTKVVGYDTSEVALAKARELMPYGRFETADIYKPVPEQYDIVLCTEVLEHLETPAVALKNLLDARAPSGVLVVTVPDGRIDYSKYHINFWSPESWKLFVEPHLPSSVSATFGTFRLSDGTIHQNNFVIVRDK